MTPLTMAVLREAALERKRQAEELGYDAHHDDQHGPVDWVAILVRQMGLASADGAKIDPGRYRRQVVRLMATACAAVEALDRLTDGQFRTGGGGVVLSPKEAWPSVPPEPRDDVAPSLEIVGGITRDRLREALQGGAAADANRPGYGPCPSFVRLQTCPDCGASVNVYQFPGEDAYFFGRHPGRLGYEGAPECPRGGTEVGTVQTLLKNCPACAAVVSMGRHPGMEADTWIVPAHNCPGTGGPCSASGRAAVYQGTARPVPKIDPRDPTEPDRGSAGLSRLKVRPPRGPAVIREGTGY